VTSLPEVYRAVFASDWFDGVPAAVRDDVMSRTRRRALASGQRVYSREETPDGIYRVVEGSIRLSGTSREGRETLLDFYGPGVWFGEIATLAGTPRMLHDAEAEGPASLLHLASLDLEELLAAHPSLSRALLRLEAQRMQILFAALQSYSSQTMEQRLATRLLMLASTHGVALPMGLKIDLHLPQETVAHLIGSTRQRVNQILRSWECDRVIEHQYGRIIVLDPAQLEREALRD
jgi:CRP/FNR family cyclic AMP-dependent transcriptional regulator